MYEQVRGPLLREADKRKEQLINELNDLCRQISGLMRHVTEEIDCGAGFFNPNLKKCYEVENCAAEDCVCYGKGIMRCWQVTGTYCGGEVQGDFAQKYVKCTECKVFKEAIPGPIYQIGEQFNNMMYIAEVKNNELEKANKEITLTQSQLLQQEKMATIGQLAAGVAHEINNPMGFISSNLGTLGKYTNKLTEFINTQTGVIESLQSTEASDRLKDTRRKLKLDYIFEDIEELIKESVDGAERVKKIVQNLKTFSRVDGAEHKYANINECIESTLNIVRNELKYKAVVEKEYGELPQTKCYPQQLNQVFVNLLVNAAQAIEKQGVIKIRTWNGDGFISVSISDTGQGIPEEKIKRIFDPFFTTKDVGKGTGLGLSITCDIVKKHKGEITVESEVGKGSAFTVKIPVVEGKGAGES
ncbi:MAG TPA: GHKL domain-containing protein [Nitrospirae bacterium]|nr:GHKL domain-containing protein [Nitrospirota bacterium]